MAEKAERSAAAEPADDIASDASEGEGEESSSASTESPRLSPAVEDNTTEAADKPSLAANAAVLLSHKANLAQKTPQNLPQTVKKTAHLAEKGPHNAAAQGDVSVVKRSSASKSTGAYPKVLSGAASRSREAGGRVSPQPQNRSRSRTSREGKEAKEDSGGSTGIPRASNAACSNQATRGHSRHHGKTGNHGRHGEVSNRARRNASRERTRHREEPPDHQVNVTLPNLSLTPDPKTPTNQEPRPAASNQEPRAASDQEQSLLVPSNQDTACGPSANQEARLSPARDSGSSVSSGSSSTESPPPRPKLPSNQAARASPLSNGESKAANGGIKASNDTTKEAWVGPASLATVGPSQPIQYNWQASKGTVKERLTCMFNNEVMADVHFLVGKGDQIQKIPAHKFVLSVGSAVFDAMFNGGMATTSAEIELPDIEPAAFLALLRFLYSDEVHIGPETVMTTLYTAKKYAVPALERACVDFLKRNLSPDNAFMLLTQARLFDEPQLAGLCLETIDKSTNEAVAAEGFTDIDIDTLCVVLERDSLGIRECKLFKAVCRWAEAECVRQDLEVTPGNKRSVLSPALTKLRFPLMTVEEFAMGPAQTGILEDREVVELFLYFTVNPKPTIPFPDVPRCCLTGKEQCVSRFVQVESRWGYSGTSDRIRFMVNRHIFVVGFGLYGSIHAGEYNVNIQIIHTDTGKLCGVNETSFTCDGTTATAKIMFKEPVEIQPNVSYTACATLKGPDSYYGTKGLRKVTHESVASGKVTFQFTYAAGNNNGTSVEDGQIPEIVFYT